MPHQVDDAVELVGLEGQQPLVVAEREGGDGVGADVLVVARHLAVLGEHRAALLVLEEVPLVGADERVDAHVLLGVLVGEERRDVGLVELRRAVQRHLRPHRVEAGAEGGAAEAVVRRLQLLAGGRVRPHHHVGVGAQTADVVDAAHDRVGLVELGEELLDLGALGRAVRVGAQHVTEAEDRPHGVADRVVDLAHAGGVGHGVAHGTHCAAWLSPARARPHARG